MILLLSKNLTKHRSNSSSLDYPDFSPNTNGYTVILFYLFYSIHARVDGILKSPRSKSPLTLTLVINNVLINICGYAPLCQLNAQNRYLISIYYQKNC